MTLKRVSVASSVVKVCDYCDFFHITTLAGLDHLSIKNLKL